MHTASDRDVPLAEASPTSTEDRLEASVAMAAWCVNLGVDVVRVHDVATTVEALTSLTAS